MLDNNQNNPEKILYAGLKSMGLIEKYKLSPEDINNIISKLILYMDILIRKNQVMNLTAITDPVEIVNLHFLDSCAAAVFFDFNRKSLIDIGSGAGFPGMPLKILIPDLDLTLLDAQNKRVDFLKSLGESLNLNNINYIHGRAEETARDLQYHENFDFAVSRAVAALPVLIELALPFVKIGGRFLAMKSIRADQELSDAARAIQILGGEVEKIQDYTIPGADISHRLIIIHKIKPTPSRYPRAFAKIKKSPL